MKRITAFLGAAALVGAVAAAPAGATNGMDMIGYGPRSIGMGGADVAVDADASAASGNPAVVSGTAPRSANIGATALMPDLALDLDGAGPAPGGDGEKQVFLMPFLGYAHSIGGTPWTVGLGVYAQGGMGVDFKDVTAGMDPATGTPITDEITSQVAFLRVNPLVAYRVNDAVSLGATVMLGYAQAKFSLFPTLPAQMGGGLDVDDLWSWGYAGKVGAQFKLGEKFRLGVTYLTESKIDLDNGSAKVNFGPMGVVKYDAKMEDFTWPQELEFGVAYLPAKNLTIAADVKWINWSATIDKPVLKLSNPNVAGAPPAMDLTFDMNWDDQWVYALGGEYVRGAHAFRAGFNYGKSPVPDAQLNPLFPAIVEKHLTLGYGYSAGKWSFDLAYEHAFEKTQNGTNPLMPSEISHSQNTVSLGATYRY